MAVTPVRELDLDLEAFEGPFDLLLTLLLKDEIEPGEVDVAAIVLAFVEPWRRETSSTSRRAVSFSSSSPRSSS